MTISSIILYAALHTGQPCEHVFQEMARSAMLRPMDVAEQSSLDELARSACEINNPDIIWQLVFQESNFRFLIARENLPQGDHRIYEGMDALRFLNRIEKSAGRNIDIGPMQINWGWHRRAFANNPMRMLSPSAQVDYLVDSYGGEIFQRCMGRWIGCYHNSNDKARAKRYEIAVLEKGRLLRLYALGYIRKARERLDPERRWALPAIRKDELAAVLASSQDMALPTKDFFRLAPLL